MQCTFIQSRKCKIFLALFLCIFTFCFFSTPRLALCAPKKALSTGTTVYDSQPSVQENELLRFLEILPKFRTWAHTHHEEAHPTLSNGRPDFLYSENAAKWVKTNGWEPRRFFCVMGRMAAAFMIAEEGNDLKGTRPRDMPRVDAAETQLARKHLGKMLEASGAVTAAPNVPVSTPVLPQRR